MILDDAVKIAQKSSETAKSLNYAYSNREFFGLVFTKSPTPFEVLGGTIIVVNKKTAKTQLLPIRPQTISALEKHGKLTKIFSVADKQRR